jgi:hypothetical protein
MLLYYYLSNQQRITYYLNSEVVKVFPYIHIHTWKAVRAWVDRFSWCHCPERPPPGEALFNPPAAMGLVQLPVGHIICASSCSSQIAKTLATAIARLCQGTRNDGRVVVWHLVVFYVSWLPGRKRECGMVLRSSNNNAVLWNVKQLGIDVSCCKCVNTCLAEKAYNKALINGSKECIPLRIR